MYTSTESLQFQRISSLGLALERVFQEAIDYKNSIPFSEQKEKVKKYCTSKLKNNIIKAYKSTANITVHNVIFIHDYPSLMFAIMPGKTEEQAIRTFEISDQGYGTNKISTPDKEIKEMIELYKATKDKSTKLGSLNYGKNKSLEIVLYFDTAMGLLLDHYISPEITQTFTAKELTAIYLHETGHLYYALERFEDTFYCVNRITDQLVNLSTKYSSVDIAESVLEHEKELKDIVKDLKDTTLTKYIDLTFKSANTILYLKEKSDEDLKYIGIVEAIVGLLTKAIMFFEINIIHFPLIHGLGNILNFIGERLINHQASSTDKYSDIRNSIYHYAFREKDADEYAVRSGYGDQLISSMRKFTKIEETISTLSNTPISWDSVQTLSTGYYLIKWTTIFYKNSIYNESSVIYESMLDRCASMCQAAIPALKTLPPTEQGIWLLRYEQSLKQLKELQKESKCIMTPFVQFCNLIVTSPSTILESIVSGRISNDYYKLQKQLDELVNNRLYFYGLKIKQMSK